MGLPTPKQSTLTVLAALTIVLLISKGNVYPHPPLPRERQSLSICLSAMPMSGNRCCLLHDAFTKVQSLLFQQVNVRHDTSHHQHLYTVERELLNVRQSASQELRRIYRGDTFFQGCRGIRDDVLARDAVPSLLPVQRWRSAKASPTESVTLVTQLTVDRLPMLQAQCAAWKEPLAASVYVPFVPNVGVLSYEVAALNGSAIHDVIDLLNDFVAFTEACADCCALELELVVETHATMESPFAKLYPVNAMRNRALLLADTDVILLLDVDFVPSASLSYRGKSIEYEILVSQLESGAVMVVPAFEVLQLGSLGVARQFALQVVAESDKMQIADAMQAGQLSGFHLRNWWPGHGATNYLKWLQGHEAYEIEYEQSFEPYLLALKHHVPYYDERFRGYTRNKATHIMHLALQLKLKLLVHPGAFVVHLPHPPAATKAATISGEQYSTMTALWGEVSHDIQQERYVPVVAFGSMCPLNS